MTLYLVFKITIDGVKLHKITKDHKKLDQFFGYPHIIIHEYQYKGRYIMVAPNKGVSFKSFVNQLLRIMNTRPQKIKPMFDNGNPSSCSVVSVSDSIGSALS